MKSFAHSIAIFGMGNVGSHVAMALIARGLVSRLSLIDIIPGRCLSQRLDLSDSVCYAPHNVDIVCGDYASAAEADIIIIAAGPLPKPGQDRLDSLGGNLAALKQILPEIKKTGFDGYIITITNPADIIAAYTRRFLGYSSSKVFSTGAILDSARLRMAISEQLRLDPSSVQAYMMGEHGTSQFAPWSLASIGGLPIDSFLASDPSFSVSFSKEAAERRGRFGGVDIFKGKGRTEFGIGAACAALVDAIYNDRHSVFSLSVCLKGHYGTEDDIYASVPAVVSSAGIERVLDMPLTESEKAKLASSLEVIREYNEKAERQ